MALLRDNFWSWVTTPYERSSQRLEDTMCYIAQTSERGAELVSFMRERIEAGEATLRFTTPEEVNLSEWTGLNGLMQIQMAERPSHDQSARPLFAPGCTAITLNHLQCRSTAALVCHWVHEARHCEQVWRYPSLMPATPDGRRIHTVAHEADADAQVFRIAYEMKEAGDPAPWTFCRTDPLRRDIALAYEFAIDEGVRAAMIAAHVQWDRSPARLKVYAQELGGADHSLLHSPEHSQELLRPQAIGWDRLELPRGSERSHTASRDHDREYEREHARDLDMGYGR